MILGGAALQRCSNCVALDAALAPEVKVLGQNDFFRSLYSRAVQHQKENQ